MSKLSVAAAVCGVAFIVGSGARVPAAEQQIAAPVGAQTPDKPTANQPVPPTDENTSPATKDEHQNAASTKGKKVTSAQGFLTEAGQGGHAEVSLGNLAAERASSADVKQFAQRMVTDHGKANQELSWLAQQKGWTVPSGPAPKHKAEEQRLGRLTGVAFDKAYMQHMVKDHEKDVRMFEEAARRLDVAELKAWIEKTLPTLRQHLESARSIATSLGEPRKTSNNQ
jgi:putative membrane protein